MRVLLAALLCLFTACGPLIEADGSIDEFCQDLQRIEIPAAPPDLNMSATLQQTATLSLPDDVRAQLQGTDAELSLTSVRLIGEGVPDLSFISDAQAKVDLGGTEHGLTWTREEPTSNSITVQPDAPIDVTPLLQPDAAPPTIDATITGTLPQTAWTLRIRGCFTGRVRLAWSP